MANCKNLFFLHKKACYDSYYNKKWVYHDIKGYKMTLCGVNYDSKSEWIEVVVLPGNTQPCKKCIRYKKILKNL